MFLLRELPLWSRRLKGRRGKGGSKIFVTKNPQICVFRFSSIMFCIAKFKTIISALISTQTGCKLRDASNHYFTADGEKTKVFSFRLLV